MSVLTIIKYALQFINMLMARLDREEFKQMGRNEVIVEQTKILNDTIARAQAEWDKVDNTPIDDLRKELQE